MKHLGVSFCTMLVGICHTWYDKNLINSKLMMTLDSSSPKETPQRLTSTITAFQLRETSQTPLPSEVQNRPFYDTYCTYSSVG